MQKLQVIGNVGNDAIIKEVKERKVISFTVAVNKSYKDSNDVKRERTNWINCSIWKNKGDSVKVAEFIKKGDKIYLEGEPEIQTYKDKDQNFQAAMSLDVKVIVLLSAKKE